MAACSNKLLGYVSSGSVSRWIHLESVGFLVLLDIYLTASGIRNADKSAMYVYLDQR